MIRSLTKLTIINSDYAVEVFFKRHDKNRYRGRKHAMGDNIWSRREQVGARKELIEVY